MENHGCTWNGTEEVFWEAQYCSISRVDFLGRKLTEMTSHIDVLRNWAYSFCVLGYFYHSRPGVTSFLVPSRTTERYLQAKLQCLHTRACQARVHSLITTCSDFICTMILQSSSNTLLRLCLVEGEVWILVEIKDDVTEKFGVYDRLM